MLVDRAGFIYHGVIRALRRWLTERTASRDELALCDGFPALANTFDDRSRQVSVSQCMYYVLCTMVLSLCDGCVSIYSLFGLAVRVPLVVRKVHRVDHRHA